MDETTDPINETGALIPSDSPPPEDAPAEETPNAVKADRTKQQIEKLKEHNNELKEAKDKAEAEAAEYKSLFEASQPIVEPVVAQTPQITPELSGMVDEQGYLDGNKLVGTLTALEKRAKDAEDLAKRLDQDNKDKAKQAFEREEKEATLKIYAKYPHLDPLNVDGVEVNGELIKFDPKFYDYVYKELAFKAKKGEMPTQDDYMQAADKVHKDLYEGREMTKADEEKKTKIEDQKRQINATRPRSPIEVGYYDQDEDAALTQAVRAGKRGAVGEALRRQEERNKTP
jgi:hypothetical protein